MSFPRPCFVRYATSLCLGQVRGKIKSWRRTLGVPSDLLAVHERGGFLGTKGERKLFFGIDRLDVSWVPSICTVPLQQGTPWSCESLVPFKLPCRHCTARMQAHIRKSTAHRSPGAHDTSKCLDDP